MLVYQPDSKLWHESILFINQCGTSDDKASDAGAQRKLKLEIKCFSPDSRWEEIALIR